MRASFYSVRAAAVANLALSAACAAQVPVEHTAGAVDGQHPCQVERAQILVGRAASQATLARARRLSTAPIIRIVKPGQPISMDYMTDRLTVEVDEKNRILRLYCG